MAISADGSPVIAYHDFTNSDLKVAKCSTADCSANWTTFTVDGASAITGQYTSIAVPADGLPIISYYDITSFDLKVVKCGNANCNVALTNKVNVVDSFGNTGIYTSIAISADGLPIISYFTGTSSDLKVAKCGNADCSSGNAITTVDSADSVGHYTSIAVPADGLPVISYHDATNGDLKIAKCGDAACASGNTITVVDSVGFVGQFTSIAISADGFPVVSYHDFTNADLKVLKCGNALCNAGNLITTIDSAGNVGQFSSITVPHMDGLPIISYYDATNGSLKVVKCSNAACLNP
jgi:hypothetical protein